MSIRKVANLENESEVANSLYQFCLPGETYLKVPISQLRLQQGKSSKSEGHYLSTLFHIVSPSEGEEQAIIVATDCASFFKQYNDRTLLNKYNFSEYAPERLMKNTLVRVKKYCLNALPGTINESIPYNTPSTYLQRVCKIIYV